MNPEEQSDLSGQDPAKPGFCLDDVYYSLFRRKWLLLAFTCLGALAAGAVWFIKPPRYESKAALMVRYVADTKIDPDKIDSIKSMDYGADSLIKTEVQIIYSLDVAAQVADIVTPEKILAKKGGGNDRMSAAGVIQSGIEVEPPRSAVFTIVFRHPDREVVQPVLRALIDKYMDKHREVHGGGAEREAYFSKQRDVLREKLQKTEDDLKQHLMLSKGMSVSDAKKVYLSQIETLMIDLHKTRTDLAEARAVTGEARPVAVDKKTNGVPATIPQDKVDRYSRLMADLDHLKTREAAFLLKDYTLQHPLITNVQWQIKKADEQRILLEKQYPPLAALRPMLPSGTNTAGVDIAAEMLRVRRLSARVEDLSSQLTNLQSEAAAVLTLEPIISRLQRELEQHEKEYRYYLSTLDQSHIDAEAGNMSVVQQPTPPGLDTKKMFKLLATAFGGCVGLGLALAFGLDFVIDRTIKRSVEVTRHLRIPLLISIPDSRWNGSGRSSNRRHHHRSSRRNGSSRHSEPANGNGALVRWDSRQSIQLYANGLRERLITYFEGNTDFHGRPKRVALTSCASGAGVTTIANSLAAALSKVPNVKVLLVDMNIGSGVARTFQKGEACTTTQDAPAMDDDASSGGDPVHSENLAVVPMRNGDHAHSTQGLPTGLAHLAPQFEANDHDFIIFDLPPASPTSMTPRLSGYMDIVLLVLESEKTGRETARHAADLMKDSRANVAGVLNKYRKYVPEKLVPEF